MFFRILGIRVLSMETTIPSNLGRDTLLVKKIRQHVFNGISMSDQQAKQQWFKVEPIDDIILYSQ
jgi:hypothetical protein